MLSGAASTALSRIASGERPPVGTGPLGAPGGGRWISVADVLAWNAKAYTERDAMTWNVTADADAVRARHFSGDEIPLRDYQLRACECCMDVQPTETTFRSGCILMGCGDGKTRVGAELIRRSRRPAVVLAPHSVGVDQWVDVLREFVTSEVTTLSDARATWRINAPLPDVLVATYHSLVRVTKAVDAHRECITTGTNGRCVGASDDFENRLVIMLMCERFGVLILDEVHMAVADHFISAGRLRSSVVYGLSGSLVREDERIGRLRHNVGPTLFTHFVERTLVVHVVVVPMTDAHKRTLSTLRRHTRPEQSFRALNPYKLHALDGILSHTHADARVIVFCDVLHAAEVLHTVHSGSLLMTGRDSISTRDATLARFCASSRGVLICTRICDASINFPPGCVIVQYHVSCASRQQETQRCGRGTRDISHAVVHMYHIVNDASEEIHYVSRRVAYLQSVLGDGMTVRHIAVAPDDVVLSAIHANACIGVTNLVVRRGGRRHPAATRRNTTSVQQRLNKIITGGQPHPPRHS